MALKLAEIKDMSLDEIQEQINKSRLELVEFKMKLACRQLEDTSQLRKKKKEVARLLTTQAQKALIGDTASAGVKESKPKSEEKSKEKKSTKEKKEVTSKKEEKPESKKTKKKKGEE